LTISDNYRAFGLEATISLTAPRSVTLIAPDGTATSIIMPAGQSTVTVYRNDFNQKPVLGTWKLRLAGINGAPASTLTAWSLRILGPTSPPPPPGITVSPVSGLVTTEDLGEANFTVVLNSQPAADVTVALSSSDATEGSVSVPSVTFTPANWNQAQTVTVKGVNDLLIDGSIDYFVVTDPAVSSDPDYHGLNASNVAVTNNDNDRKGKLKLEAAAMGQPLGGSVPGQGDLDSILAAARLQWAAAGANLDQLDSIEIAAAPLPGRTLGLADGRTIWIDAGAAGWGWFVDTTPGDDAEFVLPGNQGEWNRMDLLTVVMHELGHLLGHDHDADGVMAETLAAGVRRTTLEHNDIALTDQVLGQASDHRDDAWLGAWLTEQFDSAHGRAKRRR
jgi:hypothetical protein